MRMLVMLAALLTLLPVGAAQLTQADKQWAATVEQMIKAGAADVLTPKPQRVEIARKLAQKYRRKIDVTQSKAGYRIRVHK